MGALHAYVSETSNPLDVIERLAERCDWSVDRTNDSEVSLVVSAAWSDIYVSLNWRDDLESLHVACTIDAKVPEVRRVEVARLFNLINAQLFHGHFDLWDGDGSIVYRNTLVLAGGAIANDQQCEALIRFGLEYCECYFPALQFVCWAGRTAEDALESSMFETVGQA